MTEIESRQVRRARERSEASPSLIRATHPRGNRASRRSERKKDDAIIVRPASLNAVASCKRARRDYRIRHKLRAARGMVHPRTISQHRYIALRIMSLIFTAAAKRAEERRAAA